MENGIFITFEGCDGVGKSTQVALLAERLRKAGVASTILRDPGGTALGEEIRQLIRRNDFTAPPCRETELLLFLASRAQLVEEKILPALRRGDVVVCDRYYDSTVAYQGAARAIPLADIVTLNNFAMKKCIPDLTFLLDMTAKEGFQRVQQDVDRSKNDRLENESLLFFEKVCAAYGKLAKENPQRFCVINGKAPVDAVHGRVWNEIMKRFSLHLENTSP
jgi:dTMP kinase